MSSVPVRAAVFPVAGRGTRFLPVTKNVPKEVLPIVDRPCIEYVVAEAVAAGIEQMVFVTSAGKEALVNYFRPSLGLEAYLEATGKSDLLQQVQDVVRMADVVTVRQDNALGLGHAVLQAREAVGEQDFAVLLGDDIIDAETPAIAQLMANRSQGQAVVALMEVPWEDTRKYGVCAGPMVRPDRMAIEAMVEKPEPGNAPSNFAIVGRYILPADIWDRLAHTQPGRGGEIQLTDAIASLAAEGRVHGAVFEGERFDTGHVVGLLRASIHFALKRPELRDAVSAVLAEMSER
jgi:UTP--glucose-1-phosphate uridylyltransferase